MHTHLGNTQVLDCGDLVSYTRHTKMISIQLLLQDVVPVLFRWVSGNETHLGDLAHGL